MNTADPAHGRSRHAPFPYKELTAAQRGCLPSFSFLRFSHRPFSPHKVHAKNSTLCAVCSYCLRTHLPSWLLHRSLLHCGPPPWPFFLLLSFPLSRGASPLFLGACAASPPVFPGSLPDVPSLFQGLLCASLPVLPAVCESPPPAFQISPVTSVPCGSEDVQLHPACQDPRNTHPCLARFLPPSWFTP